jgi:hypothetical protein
MRLGVKALALVALIILIPTGARAQAVIAGSVRDTSGAVLPGVTVEASSPALIEKVRTSTSDSGGQYRIEDLRPGIYKVTFTLPGFSTFEREGIELTGSFTATINAEMRVGNLQETVTVTGESPIVDVSSARRQTVINSEVLKAIPTVRSYNALVVVVPGVVTNTNDVATGTATTQFPIHGGRNNEGRMTIDGLNVGNPPGGNQPPGFSVDVGNSEEISFTTSGGLGESETAGLVMNVVPKTGGNSIHGSAFYSGSGKNLQSDNSEGTGVAAPTPLTKIYDLNGAIGGPIMRDKLWYFATARTQGSTRVNANQFYNLNAGDASKWLYAPDAGTPGFSDRTWENISGRLTWQVTPRNKIGGYWDEQWVCRKCEGNTIGITTPPVVAPEANGRGQTLPLRVPQVTWSSPVTNRLLLDAGFGGTYYGWGNFENDPNPTRDLIKVTEQCDRLRGQRQSSGHRLPLAGFRRQPDGVVYVEGLGRVRDGPPQLQGWLSGNADDRLSPVDDQQHGSLVPLQQRDPESVDADHLALDQQRNRGMGRRLRAGTVHDGTADAAGSAALRRRAQCVPRAEHRARQVPPGRVRVSRNERCGQLQGHHAAVRSGL